MPTMAMAEETICAVLHSAWNDRTPIVWPNLSDPEVHPKEGTDSWAAFHINHEGSDQVTMSEPGRRTFTREGAIILQIFVPAGQRGLADATTLAMEAVNAFEGKTVDGVRFYRVGMRTVGREGSTIQGMDSLSSAWFQVNVLADFEFDEVK